MRHGAVATNMQHGTAAGNTASPLISALQVFTPHFFLHSTGDDSMAVLQHGKAACLAAAVMCAGAAILAPPVTTTLLSITGSHTLASVCAGVLHLAVGALHQKRVKRFCRAGAWAPLSLGAGAGTPVSLFSISSPLHSSRAPFVLNGSVLLLLSSFPASRTSPAACSQRGTRLAAPSISVLRIHVWCGDVSCKKRASSCRRLLPALMMLREPASAGFWHLEQLNPSRSAYQAHVFRLDCSPRRWPACK